VATARARVAMAARVWVATMPGRASIYRGEGSGVGSLDFRLILP
jgi:hypothetical protein